MADWTTIPDASLEPGKPIRSIDGLALRDNPVAIADGAAGAPRILGEAIEVVENLPVVTVAAADTYTIDLGLTRVTGTTSTNSTSFVTAFTITINNYTGVMRFNATHSSIGDFSSSHLEILKNGVVQQSWSTTGSAARSRDVAVAPGDIITWRHRSGGSIHTSIVSSVSTSANKRYSTRSPIYLEE